MYSDVEFNVQEEIKKMRQQEAAQFQNNPKPEKKKSIILNFSETLEILLRDQLSK